ncbi:MAG TPA: DUF2971 domain-containing protein, partial [Flavisolibacter sp.]|nr:DUF2971 domain-containing protein [Flavisolibacter sp.]
HLPNLYLYDLTKCTMALLDLDWKKQFFNYLMNERDEEAFDLKLQHFPTSLFRYRKLSDYSIQNIKNNDVWLASINSLNDPFECSLKFDNDACLRLFYSSDVFRNNFKQATGVALSSLEVKRLSSSKHPYLDYLELCKFHNVIITVSPEEQIDKVQNRWKEIIKETNSYVKICCFSENNDSTLMWSHYADNHKGICIEYDFENVDSLRPFLQPIIYTNEIFSIGTFEELTSHKKIGSTLIKSKDWEYEKEWRLTIFNPPLNLPDRISVPTPKAVYLGTRFEENTTDYQKRLLDTLSAKNIQVYRMTKHSTEFKLISQAM